MTVLEPLSWGLKGKVVCLSPHPFRQPGTRVDLKSVVFSPAPQLLPVVVTPWLSGRPPWTFARLLSCPASSASPGSAEADSVHHRLPTPSPAPRKTFHRLLFALGKKTHMLNDLEGPQLSPGSVPLPPWPGLFWFWFFILKACQSFFGDAFQVPDMNPPHSSPALAAWAVCLALYQGLADSCCYGSDLSSGCAVLSRLRTIRGYKPLWDECIPSVCSTRWPAGEKSGLLTPLPQYLTHTSACVCVCACACTCWVAAVVSDSLWPYGL